MSNMLRFPKQPEYVPPADPVPFTSAAVDPDLAEIHGLLADTQQRLDDISELLLKAIVRRAGRAE